MLNISLRQLQIFVAIAREGSASQAAETLFISKPAVSMALSELEKQLDQTLFLRQKNRLHLNEHGKALLPLADELLSRSESIDKLFRQESILTGSLKIGASETIGNQLIPYLIRDFRQFSGHDRQSLALGNSAGIAEMLLSFDLDIGFIEGRVEHPDLNITPWKTDEMVIVSNPSHPLCHNGKVSWADLNSQPWILREQGSGTRDYFSQHVASHLETWKTEFELSNTEAIINSVAAGLGLTCISRHTVTHALADNRVVILPTPANAARQFWMVRHKQKYASPLLENFEAYCRDWRH